MPVGTTSQLDPLHDLWLNNARLAALLPSGAPCPRRGGLRRPLGYIIILIGGRNFPFHLSINS
jgi:hypothetical protein